MHRAARAHPRSPLLTTDAKVRAGVDAALDRVGAGRIDTLTPVGGGCISSTMRVRTTSGAVYFLKSADDLPAGIFAAEAGALAAVDETRAVRVPAVIALDDDVARADRWLLLEWLEPGSATASSWETLGASLASLHRKQAEAPGWSGDNFIGSLPQANSPAADWPDFWRLRRLEPQIRSARDAGELQRADVGRFDRLMPTLDEILEAGVTDGASLLHGDLWSGNVHVLASGEPALIDPSAYYGHREVDLAMSELFGGFDRAFREAYEAAWPLQPGFARERRPVYQLYYLLVHVNLFGGAYRAGTLEALRAIGF